MTQNHEPFDELKRIAPGQADSNAKARALDLAMAAFDEAAEKNSNTSQGSAFGARLKSMFSNKGIWTMNSLTMKNVRLPLGVAAAGLLLFPLSMQLMNSTMLDGFSPPVFSDAPGVEKSEADGDVVSQSIDDGRSRELSSEIAEARDMAVTRQAEPEMFAAPMESAPVTKMLRQDNLGAVASGQSGNDAFISKPQNLSPVVAEERRMQVPADGGDNFAEYAENGFVSVGEAPVSTFSVDVDTASYAYVRRSLEAGMLPPVDAVRVEEMINYFSYDYPAPDDASAPFRQNVTVYPSPWNEGTMLMHVGIKGYVPDLAEAKPANIVLLIDSSGSMNDADKLPLLKRSFGLLLDQLGPDDTVSIVTYAGSAGVVLEPTPASEARKIRNALDGLAPGGSTAGAAGIEAAYRLAEEAARDGSNNRVLLATDGDFNVGISNPDQLKRFIERKRDDGIFLSVLGFGSGNYNDQIMQTLAQNGNGVAAYIDSFREAQKVLATQVQGTLNTIAKDVKVQVEFNPAMVAEYRLVGYESRALNREDFNNDKVDAGDIGAGHTVTAIYEFTPLGSATRQVDPLRYQEEEGQAVAPEGETNEYGFLKLRYKLPDESQSRLVTEPVRVEAGLESLADAPDDVRFVTAVAGFAQKLRGSQYVDGIDFDTIRVLAAGARGVDSAGYRTEFLSLVDIGASLFELSNR